MALTSGQTSDYKGAGMLLKRLPQAKYLPVDRRYDATWFGKASRHKGITPRVPSRECRKTPVDYDKILYSRCFEMEE